MLKSQIARFVVTVLAWLPVAFVVWYFAAPLLLWPVKLLAEAGVRIGAGDLVRAVEQQGSIRPLPRRSSRGRPPGPAG
jgi:hypothetical protein